jgi:hypothetical protein
MPKQTFGSDVNYESKKYYDWTHSAGRRDIVLSCNWCAKRTDDLILWHTRKTDLLVCPKHVAKPEGV